MSDPTAGDGQPQCAACHRPLKAPSPTGLGPVCRRKLHGPQSRRGTAARTAAPAPPIPGQLALDDCDPTTGSHPHQPHDAA